MAPLLTRDLSQHPPSPQDSVSPVLRYMAAPTLSPTVKSHSSLPTPAVRVPPGPHIALFCCAGEGGVAASVYSCILSSGSQSLTQAFKTQLLPCPSLTLCSEDRKGGYRSHSTASLPPPLIFFLPPRCLVRVHKTPPLPSSLAPSSNRCTYIPEK